MNLGLRRQLTVVGEADLQAADTGQGGEVGEAAQAKQHGTQSIHLAGDLTKEPPADGQEDTHGARSQRHTHTRSFSPENAFWMWDDRGRILINPTDVRKRTVSPKGIRRGSCQDH